MSVSIIAGAWRGRKLDTPPGKHTRPLLGRIKQSLFDMLGQQLDDLQVIDVCAGSGSFGFEAASRGAASVHFIENDKSAHDVLHENLNKLNKPQNCHIHYGRFQDILPQFSGADLIYADPPFPWYRDDQPQLLELMNACAAALAQDGRFLIRGDKGQALPPRIAPLVEKLHKSYGRSWIRQFSLSN